MKLKPWSVKIELLAFIENDIRVSDICGKIKDIFLKSDVDTQVYLIEVTDRVHEFKLINPPEDKLTCHPIK